MRLIYQSLILLSFLAGNIYAVDSNEALNSLKNALSKKMNMSMSDMKLIKNRHGHGKSLYIQTYATNARNLQYKPKRGSMSRAAGHTSKEDYQIFTSGKATKRVILVNYLDNSDEFEIYFDDYNKNKGKSATYNTVTISRKAQAYLVDNFQTMVVDEPMIIVGIKYLQAENKRLNQKSNISFHTKFIDPQGNDVFIDKEGYVIAKTQLKPFQSCSLKTVHYISELVQRDRNIEFEYHPVGRQLVKYRTGKNGKLQKVATISLQKMLDVIQQGEVRGKTVPSL